MNNTHSINCGNIRFSDKELCELDGTQILISVPKKDITSITADFGNAVERPLAQFGMGLVLCLLGLYLGLLPIRSYLLNPIPVREPLYAFKPMAYALPLIGIGLYLIIPVFRKSNYLRVSTLSGERKLEVKDCDPSKVLSIGQQLGYPINTNSSPNKRIETDAE